MNNQKIVKELSTISFSSQSQLKKLDLFVKQHQNLSENEMTVISSLLQTNSNVDRISQLLAQAFQNMGELHID